MSKIKNCWLRGFLRTLWITALVLMPYVLISRPEIYDIGIILLSMLTVGTLIFGLINKYYPEESNKQK